MARAMPEDLDPLAGPAMNRALPGLRPALDAQVMGSELQACLLGNGSSRLVIEECTPGKAMYLGPEGVSLRYALRVRDRDSGEVGDELVLGRLLPGPEEAEVYRRELEPLAADLEGRPELRGFATPFAVSRRVPGLVVHAFPVDRDLPTLVQVTDRRRMIEIFTDLLRADFEVRDVNVDAGHYGRRHRCVLRYELEVSSHSSARGRSVVFGKVYAGDTGEMVARVIPAARKSLSEAPTGVAIPTHLRYLPELHLSLLGRVSGAPAVASGLKKVLAGPQNGEAQHVGELVGDAGRVAAAMHGWSVPFAPPRTLADDAAYLWRHLVEMESFSPALSARLAGALQIVEIAGGRRPAGPLRFGHGDYTYSQLLHDGPSVALVDFDSACRAEPALDIGHFLAYLQLGVAKYQSSPSSGAEVSIELSRRFLESYTEADGGVPLADLEERARVFSGLSLVRIAVHAWLKLKPERVKLVLPLLDEGLKQLI